jgi:type 1 glutamine amidotransferase
MKCAVKFNIWVVVPVCVLILSVGYVCSCNRFGRPGRPLPAGGEKINVVVITGGHGFEEGPFFTLFEGHDDIEYVRAPQKDHSEIFENVSSWDYDVVVLYNMTQEISPKRQANFVKLLDGGVGLVVLHHSIGAFQGWPEYRRIIGAKFYLNDTVENGVAHKKSAYKHNVEFKVHVEDQEHPITRGMSDFAIRDETYKNSEFEPDNRVLLTTDEPTSDEQICWVRSYGKARVCYIQLGHGPSAYANPSYRRLVGQAVRWCARRLVQ